MTPAIRPAVAADLVPLAQLARQTYVAAFGHTYEAADDLTDHVETQISDAAVAGWLDEDTVLIADVAGRLAGFAQLGVIEPGTYGGFAPVGSPAVHRLYVAADVRSAGLGTTLLRACLARAGGPPAHDVYLDVWEGNFGAQRLYARHGFTPLGRVPLRTASGAGAGVDIVMVRRAG